MRNNNLINAIDDMKALLANERKALDTCPDDDFGSHLDNVIALEKFISKLDDLDTFLIDM